MSGFLTATLAFLVAIGILVAVHEWGHYIVARMLGVKVLRFSIGFGRPLWLRRWGPDQTEYCVASIPIGGYVRLLDERDSDVPEGDLHRTFNRQSVPARVAILLAGPLLNFIFAVLAYWCMFVIGVPGLKPVVGEVMADSVAAAAGLRDNDEIVAVGDKRVSTWEGAVIAMLDQLLADGDIALDVSRGAGTRQDILLATRGREAELTEPGALFEVLGLKPWAPTIAPILGELTPGGPAERAGFEFGDLVVQADSENIDSWPAWVEFVRARPGKTLSVIVLRSGARKELLLPVERVEEAGGEVFGRIGAGVDVPPELYAGMRAAQRYALVPAFSAATTKTWDMAALTVRMLGRMVTGDVSVKNISGPINIAQFAGYSATSGPATFLGFLAIVSISLGILNLLPVPMLDGGQIVYQLAEAVKGAPLSERAQLVGQQVGILFLIVLMSFAFYNDIARLIG